MPLPNPNPEPEFRHRYLRDSPVNRKGTLCKIISKTGLRSAPGLVQIEFEDGVTTVVPRLSIRRDKGVPPPTPTA